MKKYVLAAAASVAIAAFATPAVALEACDPTLTNPDADACVGHYEGNILSGSAGDIAAQQAAIASLPGDFVWDGNWTAVEATKQFAVDLVNGSELHFGTTLYGLTVIGAHFGNIAGADGNVTVFWQFDFGTEGAQFISLDSVGGFSDAVLYTTTPPAVPEPGTWLLMMLGFGAIGFGMRRNKNQQVRVRFAGI